MTIPSASDRPRHRDELPSFWRALRALEQRLDDGITALYGELGIKGVGTRFSMALMFLEEGPLTIRELAERSGVTHSAMSQSVAAMREAALVSSEPGADARSRMIALTPRGRSISPLLWAEWYATEAALAELDAEAGHPLEAFVRGANEALDREPFASRLRRHLRP